MIDIAAIRAATNLVALIGERIELRRRSREYYGLCPFHNERTPSFSVVPDKGFYHCHGCGAHGDALDWIMRTENLSLPEAAKRLGGEPADDATRERLAAEKQRQDDRRRARMVRHARLAAYRDVNSDCSVPDWAIDTSEPYGDSEAEWRYAPPAPPLWIREELDRIVAHMVANGECK